MATTQQPTTNKPGLFGKILISLGFVALVADLAFLAQPIESLILTLKEGLFAVVPTLGLSVANAVRALALNQLDYFSLISRILVLFSAMVAVIIGFALIRPRSANASGANDLINSSFNEQESHNG